MIFKVLLTTLALGASLKIDMVNVHVHPSNTSAVTSTQGGTAQCPNDGGTITALMYSQYYQETLAFTTIRSIYFLGLQNNIPVQNYNFLFTPLSSILGTIDAIVKIDSYIYVFREKKYFVYQENNGNGHLNPVLSTTGYSIHSNDQVDDPLLFKVPSYVLRIHAACNLGTESLFFAGNYVWRWDNAAKALNPPGKTKIKIYLNAQYNIPSPPEWVDAAYVTGDDITLIHQTKQKAYRIAKVGKSYQLTSESISNFMDCT